MEKKKLAITILSVATAGIVIFIIFDLMNSVNNMVH